MELGQRLKAKRKEKKLSAEYIAKKLGVSVSTVYRYEDSSIVKIPVSTFEKMCNILETTPAEMMGNIPEKSHDKNNNEKSSLEHLKIRRKQWNSCLNFRQWLHMEDMIHLKWMIKQWLHLQMKYYSSYNLLVINTGRFR